MDEGTHMLTVPCVPGLHRLLKDAQKRLWRALVRGGEQQAHVVHRQSELLRGCRNVNQRPQASPLEGVDRTLALPLLDCRLSCCMSCRSLAVTPGHPPTLGGGD